MYIFKRIWYWIFVGKTINGYLTLAKMHEKYNKPSQSFSILEEAIFTKGLKDFWLFNNFAVYSWMVAKEALAYKLTEEQKQYYFRVAFTYFIKAKELLKVSLGEDFDEEIVDPRLEIINQNNADFHIYCCLHEISFLEPITIHQGQEDGGVDHDSDPDVGNDNYFSEQRNIEEADPVLLTQDQARDVSESEMEDPDFSAFFEFQDLKLVYSNKQPLWSYLRIIVEKEISDEKWGKIQERIAKRELMSDVMIKGQMKNLQEFPVYSVVVFYSFWNRKKSGEIEQIVRVPLIGHLSKIDPGETISLIGFVPIMFGYDFYTIDRVGYHLNPGVEICKQ